ncbi:ATP-dependent helicase [Rothia kristinae]|uniref:ATP-dependent helicase n=1 Tax=Rothia kristinae TaxID=37923 RepID=UPI00244B9A3C|nr:ATP-dependent DNA helicase [Rothia kristinae]WGH10053.1 ATP-dependent DNA helicase [Rothia kristinae]
MAGTGTLLLGAPGTGRSTALIRRALDFVRAGNDAASVLLLAPGRLAADRLRQEFSERIGATVSSPPARAWHSYAFDVLRRAHAAGQLPGVAFEPRLLSGPEQDVLIGQMIETHRRGIGRPPAWPTDLGEALRTRGFRREIREFLDRCAEFDLSPDQVRELGRSMAHPEWVAAADFRVEYEQLRRLSMPHAYDPSALIHEAAAFLETHPEFVKQEHTRLRLILADDLQEASPAVVRLLGALYPAGLADPAELVLTACPDTVVQGFRGARPELLTGLERRLPALDGLRSVSLSTSHRMPAGLVPAFERIAHRIPVVAGALTQRTPAQPAESTEGQPDDVAPERAVHQRRRVEGQGDGAPEVLLVGSEQEELRLLSQLILEEHVLGGRGLEEMAVIVRNGSSLARIQRHLDADGIAATVPVAETPLREEPAVRPFLDALWILTDREEEAGARALDLLTSRLGGTSPSGLRRLRQTLRARELRAGGRRSGDELLLAALRQIDGTEASVDGEQGPDLGGSGPGTAGLRRVGAVLSAGRAAMAAPEPSAETVLWALWEASGLAKTWEEASRGAGPAAQRAHRDLDAMVELFKSAERFAEQQTGAGVEQFLDYLDSQDLPMDTLAPVGGPSAAVSLLTPASAAGREWPVVIVSGVQDGVWPNLTVRGGLLAAPQLADAVFLGPEQAARVTHGMRVRETRVDELRMFAAAISRASRRLVVTAVADAETEPSELLAMLAPDQMQQPALTPVRRPMTLRGLVAELRRAAQDPQDPDRALRAADCLARLALDDGAPDADAPGEGGPADDAARAAAEDGAPRAPLPPVPGAHPQDWWGLAPLSSTEPALPAEKPVPVTPSRMEGIVRSPLDWFVAVSGGQAGTDLSRSLGTLIHEVAQDLPEAPGHELVAELRRRFEALRLPETWETEQTWQRAETMIRKFAQYAVDSRLKEGRRLAGIEGSFQVLVPGPARDALLTGRVDRLEVDQLGRYVVIDLKTGRHAPTKAQMAHHPQLAGYQVALAAGAGQAMAAQAARDGAEARDGADAGPPDAADPGDSLDATASQQVSGRQDAEPEVLELRGARLTELSGGAALVQLGTGTASYGNQQQEALGPEDQWAVDLVQRCAELIAHERFQARHTEQNTGAHGLGCALPEICPLCASGRQVTQP